jgi:hypothetical protein
LNGPGDHGFGIEIPHFCPSTGRPVQAMSFSIWDGGLTWSKPEDLTSSAEQAPKNIGKSMEKQTRII